MKVVVLTTSFPRHAGDTAGRFVADAVEHVREAGVDVDVVSPADFRQDLELFRDMIALMRS